MYSNGNGFPEGTPGWAKWVFIGIRQIGLPSMIVLLGGYWACYHVGDPLISCWTEAIRVQTKVIAEQEKSIKEIRDFEQRRVEYSERTNREMHGLMERSTKEHETIFKGHEQMLRDHQLILMGLKVDGRDPVPPKT
jgi:hypothetical protein